MSVGSFSLTCNAREILTLSMTGLLVQHTLAVFEIATSLGWKAVGIRLLSATKCKCQARLTCVLSNFKISKGVKEHSATSFQFHHIHHEGLLWNELALANAPVTPIRGIVRVAVLAHHLHHAMACSGQLR